MKSSNCLACQLFLQHQLLSWKIFYDEEPRLKLNSSELLNSYPVLVSGNLQDVTIKKSYDNVGIVVDSLGEIFKIENQHLDPDPRVISESNKLITAMVKPKDIKTKQ